MTRWSRFGMANVMDGFIRYRLPDIAGVGTNSIHLIKASLAAAPSVDDLDDWANISAHEASFKGYAPNNFDGGGVGSPLLPMETDGVTSRSGFITLDWAWDDLGPGDNESQTIRWFAWRVNSVDFGDKVFLIRRLPADKIFKRTGDTLTLDIALYDVNEDDVAFVP